jgi:hypothetical protein
MLAGVAQVQQIAAKFPQILGSSFATANRREALGDLTAATGYALTRLADEPKI